MWLHPEDKCRTASDIDRIISAEIPDPKTDVVGYNAVTEFMMHGPCGVVNTTAPCMSKGKCSKFFPKSFEAQKRIRDDCFPVYKRRDMNGEGRKVMKNGVELDKLYVIPHNVDLVVKYEAHINVELCTKSRAIKYLFKYINKGPDIARVVLEQSNSAATNDTEAGTQVDKIKIYLDCRNVSAYEACWRIF